jgi:PBP1b-binding outer membrane lipoprotein LpoB
MKQLILISLMGLLLTACGKESQTTTHEEISNFPVRSQLTGEEQKVVNELLKKGDVEEKELVKTIMKFNGSLTELNLNRIETHIEVSCKSGHCRVLERNNNSQESNK